jgi:Putative Actinobacterial Holin-X, holin superfamily III
MSTTKDERTLREMFAELTRETRTLVQQELQLAKTELTEKASKLGKGRWFDRRWRVDRVRAPAGDYRRYGPHPDRHRPSTLGQRRSWEACSRRASAICSFALGSPHSSRRN